MNILYAVKVLIVTRTEEERAAAMSNWKVEQGHPILQGLLEEIQKAKAEPARIIVTVDNQQGIGVVEKALEYFSKKYKEPKENMLVQEINYLGEGAL